MKFKELTFDKFSSSFSTELSFEKMKDLIAPSKFFLMFLSEFAIFFVLLLSFAPPFFLSSVLNDLHGCTNTLRRENDGIESQETELRQKPSWESGDWVVLWWKFAGTM